jgi:opacity protein-like surface antigen
MEVRMAHPVPVLSTLAVAAVALALGTPALAAETQGWEVTPSGNTCMMLSTFEDDVSVGLALTAPAGEISFVAAGDEVEKLAGQAGSTVSLNARFDGDVPHNDWTDDRARVVSLGHHRIAVIADWGPALSQELASTVGGSATVAIRIGDKPLGSYNLSGSRAASAELTRCGTRIAAK